MPEFSVGDMLANVVDVVSYGFGNYEVLPDETPSLLSSSLNKRERSELVGTRNRVSVATFNVENLSPLNDQGRFDELGSIIANNMRSPDIIGLQEVQDNSGAVNDGVVAADETYNRLIAAIAAAGGALYAFTDIAP